MPPQKIFDTHIHLWPSTALTPTNHAWMTPGHALAKRHGISDYLAITTPQPTGFIYVETDRYLPSSTPQDSGTAEVEDVLREWAKEPLDELRFLRRIVEGESEEGDGMRNGEGKLLNGCVIWAPFHLSPSTFQKYLHIAESTAGPKLWQKVVGFRYLLQGKTARQIRELVQSDAWLDNIASLGKKWSFDVGVDVNRDGDEGLEVVGGMVESVRNREGGGDVRFVLNHLCKPNLSQAVPPRWKDALERLGHDSNVYMKLSGAFNEFDITPENLEDITSQLRPFLDTVFANFPDRVMFGSDWPVCNVGGPKGEKGNWGFWVRVVGRVLEERGVGGDGEEGVWSRAGERAYGLGSHQVHGRDA